MKKRSSNPDATSGIIVIVLLGGAAYYLISSGMLSSLTAGGGARPIGSPVPGGGLPPGPAPAPSGGPSYAFIPGVQYVAAVPGGFQVVTKGQIRGFYTSQSAAEQAYNALIASGG